MSPMPPSMQNKLKQPQGPSKDDAKLVKGLQDPSQRNSTLNDLLHLSASHEINYSLSGDYVLRELADIAIYDCLEWTEPTEPDTKPVFRSKQCWLNAPMARMTAWVKHCKKQLDPKRSMLQKERL